MVIENECARPSHLRLVGIHYPHTHFTITSDVYKVLVNQVKSFREGLFVYHSHFYLYIYEYFMNETHSVRYSTCEYPV